MRLRPPLPHAVAAATLPQSQFILLQETGRCFLAVHARVAGWQQPEALLLLRVTLLVFLLLHAFHQHGMFRRLSKGHQSQCSMWQDACQEKRVGWTMLNSNKKTVQVEDVRSAGPHLE